MATSTVIQTDPYNDVVGGVIIPRLTSAHRSNTTGRLHAGTRQHAVARQFGVSTQTTSALWALEVLMTGQGHRVSTAAEVEDEEEGNVLFNDALNTFYLRLYGVTHTVSTIQIVREETRFRHMGYFSD